MKEHKMKIIIDDEVKDLKSIGLETEGIQLDQLSQKLSEHPSKLAILVNDKFIPKEKWQETFLKENDRVETISLIAGG